MATTFPAPVRPSYTLGEGLTNATPVESIYMPLPNEAAREDMLIAKLGARGWGRMHHFRYFYHPGWGEMGGRALSPKATESFYRFVDAVQIAPGCTPSLFFTDDGGLELRWEGNNQDIQVEFSTTGIEYYVPGKGIEGSAPHSAAASLANELSRL